MGHPLKIILGAIATMLVAIGLAAQTGTVHLPGEGRRAGGGVEAHQATASPTPPKPESSPTPEPTQAPAPPPEGPPTGKPKKH